MRVNYRFSFDILFRSNPSSSVGQNSLKIRLSLGAYTLGPKNFWQS